MTLAKVMEDRGLTDKTLAALVGVSRPYITRIRKSERTPSLKVAAELEKVTGVPAAEFLRKAA